MKTRYYIAALAATMLCAGCKDETGATDREIAKVVEVAMSEAFAAVGQPSIKNWKELKDAKMIYELRDQEDFVCYAYIITMTGDLKFLGKCIGYGLPYSVQFSNPDKVVDYNGYASVTGYNMGPIAQPEPNGLFMPDGLSATWLMLIDPTTGKPRPVYIEPQIMVSPFPIHFDGEAPE
jgi:hypothetical protein